METYLGSITTGVILFPALAFVLTMPFMIYQYRKYGSIPFWKTLMFYSFAFYILCAYFMVILPLPEHLHAAECGAISKAPKLEALTFIPDFQAAAAKVGLNLLHPSTWAAFLAQPAVYLLGFNLLLTMPLGMYARYIAKFSWWQALILGFAASLLFEVTQLTGIFGIYDYAYRLFDVDDLIVNTAGCLVGNLVMIPLARHLPQFEDLSAKALVKGARQASFTRRLAGFAIDTTVFWVLSWGVTILVPDIGATESLAIDMLIVALLFMIVPSITKGQTIGHKAVKLRIYKLDGTAAGPLNYVERYGLFIWVFLMGPNWASILMPDIMDGVSNITALCIMATVYAVWFVTVIVRAIRSALGHPFLMLNGVISNTTVMTPQQAQEKRTAPRVVKSLLPR